jgi:hypothetical protein
MEAQPLFDREIAALLNSRQLLRFEKFHFGYAGCVRGLCIAWFWEDVTTGLIERTLDIGFEENGVWWLWVQGDRREYAGLPELMDALEHLRDAIGLQPMY